MNGSGFQALVAKLDELLEVQRKALLTALKRKLPVVEQAAPLIDTPFKAAPFCGH